MAAQQLLIPAPLTQGSVVRVVAPSGPFDARLVWRGMGFLSERYAIRYDRRIFERLGYFAGSDADRCAELQAALNEPGVDAIVCARGGYGLSRYVDRIDWSLLRKAPRWLVGFSDVTAIHVEAARHAVATMHGANLTALGRSHAPTREEWVDALEHPLKPRCFDGLQGLVSGRASGPLFGGNLTLLHACAAAGRLAVPSGAVLMIEDVSEIPYRLDRMLTTLIRGGHFAGLAGLVAGEFESCRPGPDGVSVMQVLRECLAGLGIPVAAKLPVGHGRANAPLVLGAEVSLEVEGGSASLMTAQG